MATTKRERVSNSSSEEDTDVVESDGVDRNIGVIRRPKRKVKKIEKKSKSSSPSNAPAAGTSKSSGNASSSAEKPLKEEENEDERCPICLCEFGPEVAFPDSCEHKFCSGCILEWAKKVNTCPIDRSEFKYVLILNRDSSELCERIEVSKRFPKVPLVNPNPATSCMICGLEENLLTCCECFRGFHSSCLFLTLSNDRTQDWRCPYCVFREAHDGLSPIEYASPGQLRMRQYQRAQEYLQRLNRMYRVNSQQQEPLAAPSTLHLSPPVQLPEPERPPMVEANAEMSLFDLPSVVESSSDESDETTHEAESILSFFRNAVQILEAPAASTSTTSVSSSSTTSDVSSSEVEEDTVTGSSGSLLNPINVSSDSSDDEFSSLLTSSDLNEELSTSQQQTPHQGPNRSTGASSVRNLPVALSPLLPRRNNPEILEDTRVIEEGRHRNSTATHSGHENNNSRHPNGLAENRYGSVLRESRRQPDESDIFTPERFFQHSVLMSLIRRHSPILPSMMNRRLPPRDDPEIPEDGRVREEGSRRNSTALHSGPGSNNSRHPNGLAENLHGSLRESRQSAVSNVSAGGNIRRLIRMSPVPEHSHSAPTTQQLPPPVTRTARENCIALLGDSPSVITRSCISHTNQINTVPENSSSSIQRPPARPTTRQPLILPKPAPSNSSTSNGS